LAGFSVRKPFTVLVVVVVVFALGITSYRSMKPELLPNLELPYVMTMTVYPGATSEKVEAEVTRPLEQGFATLGGLKNISSQSRSNFSSITMEFADGVNLDTVTIDMLQRISQIEGGWDDLIGTPVIIKMNPDMMPAMIAAVEREGYETADLSRFMEEDLELRLEGIDGVARVDVSGKRREQVNVVIRAEKVAEVNARIAAAIEKEIDERERDLKKTKSELEGRLEDLKKSSEEIESGAKELASGMGGGWAQSGEAITKQLTRQVADLDKQLKELQDVLAAMPEMQRIATELAIEKVRDEEFGGTFPPGMEDIIVAEITARVAAEFDIQKAQIEAGIAALESGIQTITLMMPQILGQVQGALVTANIEAQHQLSNAAAQIAAAQGQLNAGIMQIEQGLEQFEDALENALKQADMSAVLTMPMISTLLQAQNFTMPAGLVRQEFTEYLVRVGDEVASIDELSDMALMDTGVDDVGVIRLYHVADVFMSDNLSDIYARIDGNDGILLEFMKQSESSTTEVTDAILEKFAELSAEYPGLKFTPFMNQGDYIYMVINTLTSNLLWGALFAVLILLLFLRDIRPTFITLCSIPISLVFALVAMYFAGVSINIISLSGLAIAVGRLVDDSVIVIENIYRLRTKGYSPIKAAVTGTTQMLGPIIATTLTSVCVFLPIVFVEGLTRQLFTDFALTYAFALAASTIIAMTLVPTLASGMFKNVEPKEHRWGGRTLAVYDRALVWSLKYKPVIIVFSVALLAWSAWAVVGKGFAYMPEGASSELAISLTMPRETTLEERRAAADEAEERLLEVEGIETFGMMSGSSQGGMMGFLMGGGEGGVMRNVSSYVLVEPGTDSAQVSDNIRAALDDMDLEINISDGGGMDASALGGSGVTVNIFADQGTLLVETARIIGEAIEGVTGVEGVNDGLENAMPEINFTVDRMKAAEHGLTTAQVFQQVNSALTAESSATEVTWRGDSYGVSVVNEQGLDDGFTPEFVRGLTFPVSKRDGTTEWVKLLDIATVSEDETLPSVLRSNQRRYLPVRVSIDAEYSVTLVAQELDSIIAGLVLPPGVTYEITGESATIMDAFEQLGFMLILGLLLVYLVMVAQFQSLLSPFIIMFTVPLAFTGGFLALLMTGTILSVISLLGFAMLVGVIVANGIVMIDYINRLRLEGMERVAAIREGAAVRLRPILMTALSTMGALAVMALGIGEGSEMMQPLAIVCIGGLAYGTMMGLFVIPVIYDAMAKKELRNVAAADLVVDIDA